MCEINFFLTCHLHDSVWHYAYILQASWYEKILERLRNKRKRPKGTSDCAVHTKKPKQSSSKVLMKRYPPRLNEDLAEDADSVKKHQSAMAAEMGKKKPREIALLPLMKDTYRSRRDFITSDDCSGIEEILNVYPALRLPAAVSNYMEFILPHSFHLCTYVQT